MAGYTPAQIAAMEAQLPSHFDGPADANGVNMIYAGILPQTPVDIWNETGISPAAVNSMGDGLSSYVDTRGRRVVDPASAAVAASMLAAKDGPPNDYSDPIWNGPPNDYSDPIWGRSGPVPAAAPPMLAATAPRAPVQASRPSSATPTPAPPTGPASYYDANGDLHSARTISGQQIAMGNAPRNLATIGNDTSDTHGGDPGGHSVTVQEAQAYNAAHPGQVGEWVNGMDPALRGKVNPGSLPMMGAAKADPYAAVMSDFDVIPKSDKVTQWAADREAARLADTIITDPLQQKKRPAQAALLVIGKGKPVTAPTVAPPLQAALNVNAIRRPGPVLTPPAPAAVPAPQPYVLPAGVSSIRTADSDRSSRPNLPRDYRPDAAVQAQAAADRFRVPQSSHGGFPMMSSSARQPQAGPAPQQQRSGRRHAHHVMQLRS